MSSRCRILRDLALLCACACLGCTEAKHGVDAAAATSASAVAIADAAARVTDAQAEAAPAAVVVDELPDGGAGELSTRARHLLEALSQDDPSLAGDIVLPREAYLTSRDAQDPGAAYDSRFKPGFETQIRRVRRHEKGMDRAVFVSFDLGPNPSRVVPRKKEWKDPLWRTRGTLTFTIDKDVHRIEVAEMIAWKGAWYVAKIR